MSVRFLADVHIRSVIVNALRANGIDIVTSQERGFDETPDTDLLDQARALGRVLLTEDADFLREASARFSDGRTFATIVRIRQRISGDSACIQGLLFFAAAAEPGDLTNHVFRIPL